MPVETLPKAPVEGVNVAVDTLAITATAGNALISIRDDGVGGADPAQGSGLVGLRDRIEAVGGALTVTSPAGHGTTLLIEMPAESENPPGTPEP